MLVLMWTSWYCQSRSLVLIGTPHGVFGSTSDGAVAGLFERNHRAAGAQHVAAHIDRYAIQPAREVPVRIQLMQRTVQAQKNLLRGVLGVLQVAVQQPHGRQQHTPLKLAQNGFESSSVAGFGLSYQARKLGFLRVGALGYHQQRQFLHAVL